MKKGKLVMGALVLLGVIIPVAVACGSTPTPAPTTAVPPTSAPPTSAPPATPTATIVLTHQVPSATATATTAAATTTAATAATTATATTTASASPTGTDITPATVRTVAVGEVVKLSGDSFNTSDTFRFSADTTVDVTWNYTGTADFALWLINQSETVTDPKYDRILVNDVTGPHSGTAKEKIIAGDWAVQVEQAEGPWTVQFSPES